MIIKTRGVVLHTTKFSESAVIAKVYTESSGLLSVLVRGVRGSKSKGKTASLQALSLIEVVIYLKQTRGVQNASDIRFSPPFTTIPNDIRKTSIVLFLAEVLKNSIHEEEVNSKLFQFIFHSLEILDLQDEGLDLFHHFFLIQLSRHLGFYPAERSSKEARYFNLVEGQFQNELPLHEYFVDENESEYFHRLMKSNFESLAELSIPKESKKIILTKLLDYLRLHLPAFKEVSSHHILAEVMA